MIDVINHREVIEDWREADSAQTELQTEQYHTTSLKPTEETEASEEENEEEEECYQVIRKRGVKRRVRYWKEPVAERKN